MVQIHGKGRYKIIANRLIGFSLNLSLEKSVELRSIRISVVVDHRLVSIRGGGVSDRGGHLVVSISHGNGSLVDNGVDGLGVSDGGLVDGVSISHGGLFNLPVLSRSLFDDSLLSISHGSGIGHGGPVDGVSISH